MRIFIDIGHPAHVHYFRNFIKLMSQKGHTFFITARDKDVSLSLLESYGIKYRNRGKGRNGWIGKFIYLIRANQIILQCALGYKPDLFVSFSSPYAAQVSWLLNNPHIALNDTEHAKLGNLAFSLFTEVICTPSCYNSDYGKKHVRFNGFMELGYLHPKYFHPNPNILNILNINNNENFIIMRFVSWDASHDFGHSGLSLDFKRKIVKELSKYAKVFISSEGALPNDLKKYQIKITPHLIHDALAYAFLFIGEGATMASECAMLGTPAIYVNTLSSGTLDEQERSGLIFQFKNGQGVLEKALLLMQTPHLKIIFKNKRNLIISKYIDVTSFLIWLVENYPYSIKIIRDNPRHCLL